LWEQRRWRFYEAWLDFMVRVVERDLAERVAREEKLGEGEGRFEESLLANWLGGPEGIQEPGSWKRALRAVFVDAGESDLKQFPEVWERELKERKKENVGFAEGKFTGKVENEDGDISKIAKIDFTNEEFLVLSQEYSPVDSSPSSPTFQPTPPRSHEPAHNPSAFTIRLRLLTALSLLCRSLGSTSIAIPYSTFFTYFRDAVLHLPLRQFALYTSTGANSPLLPEVQSSLLQLLTHPFIDNKAPVNDAEDDTYTWSTLCECYLPFAANTRGATENAKLSLCIEGLLRLWAGVIASDPDVDMSDAVQPLKRALEKGIEARREKSASENDGRRRRKAREDPEEEEARAVLEASGWRMGAVIQLLAERSV
jgi:hypothetical protein